MIKAGTDAWFGELSFPVQIEGIPIPDKIIKLTTKEGYEKYVEIAEAVFTGYWLDNIDDPPTLYRKTNGFPVFPIVVVFNFLKL